MRFISWVLFFPVLCGGGGASASPPTESSPGRIEVFNTTDTPVSGTPALLGSPDRHEIELRLYALDGIQRFEAQLSRNLPPEPKQSQQIALQRIQYLDEQATDAMRNA
ncbi:MAG: DUF1525 domain-containing protein, partial [Gammaproteobacteria bacterium]|nr:DUF1525 domain-containing protein [Gammaproteobacteria bacterium]